MTFRQLCILYFTNLGEVLFECKTCERHRKQATGMGYSNLLSHLTSKHNGYAAEFAELQASATPSIALFGFVDETTRNIYQWMVFLIQRNLQITEVENKFTLAVVTMKPTSTKSIKRYMHYIALAMEYIITKEMGTSFCLMFGGWTSH
ncbi:hypothetical protein JG687_00000638 [Phytophthora cactorum]|uniref:BED-type domain-containing protein n=1 Tax=Phytophthora cactorum TaxID=29920 RepID=A0A8T1UZJ0_9STRA|nr:hypothetical protein PC120_g9063 [Phytophthora cactorum]KAG3067736.1 hypothetical protein PC121_g10433 [Phytophthora cactorum]KAG6973924.1 hypothetical protein JG687_00000638 [Phytophthora cactorum]